VATFQILCAHFVASSRDGSGAKMRFAILSPTPNTDEYWVVRITDNGTSDTWAQGVATSFAAARSWVNKGAIGSDHPTGWTSFPLATAGSLTGFTITASQA